MWGDEISYIILRHFINTLWPSDMATWIWANTGLRNDLLPDGTKQLPEPILTFKWIWILKISNLQWCLKSLHLKSQSHLPGKKVNVWKLSDMIIVMRTLPILHVPWFFRKYVNRCWYGMLFVIHICPILWADWMHILWQIIQDKNGKASSSKLPSLICWHRPIHHWPNMAIGSQLTKMDIHKIIIWFWLNIYIILVVLLQKKYIG